MSSDPIGYVGQNPLGYADPNGLERIPCPEGSPAGTICDDGKNNQHVKPTCATAECAANIGFIPPDTRPISEVVCTTCLFSCGLAGSFLPGPPIPLSKMGFKKWLPSFLTSQGYCKLLACKQECKVEPEPVEQCESES